MARTLAIVPPDKLRLPDVGVDTFPRLIGTVRRRNESRRAHNLESVPHPSTAQEHTLHTHTHTHTGRNITSRKPTHPKSIIIPSPESLHTSSPHLSPHPLPLLFYKPPLGVKSVASSSSPSHSQFPSSFFFAGTFFFLKKFACSAFFHILYANPPHARIYLRPVIFWKLAKAEKRHERSLGKSF